MSALPGPSNTVWIACVVAGSCPACSGDLWGREIDMHAETTSCVCGATVSIPVHGIMVKAYNVPNDPSREEARKE